MAKNKWQCPVCGYSTNSEGGKKVHANVTLNDADHRGHLAAHLMDKVKDLEEDIKDSADDIVNRFLGHHWRYG